MRLIDADALLMAVNEWRPDDAAFFTTWRIGINGASKLIASAPTIDDEEIMTLKRLIDNQHEAIKEYHNIFAEQQARIDNLTRQVEQLEKELKETSDNCAQLTEAGWSAVKMAWDAGR